MNAPVIVWFRRDLRLADNPALSAAIETGRPIVPLYIDEPTAGAWAPGAASRWWLDHSLTALAASLAERGAKLTLRRGPAATVLADLVAEIGASAAFWNRRYEPSAVAADTPLAQQLGQRGVAVRRFHSGTLFEPGTIINQVGLPFRVFTPFWKACIGRGVHETPLPAPQHIPGLPQPLRSELLKDWRLLPRRPDWSAGLAENWHPGETGALTRLAEFLDTKLAHYQRERDRPDRDGSSRLSPHLQFGEVSPRQVWQATAMRAEAFGDASGAAAFLRELGWREFCHQLLFHHPHLPERNLLPAFDAFPWNDDPAKLRAWQRAQTGYPIVDAGMRQLWHTGWMHNRVRMITGSFLVKHLLQPWQQGEAWFWDTLVDADLANNAAGWQWIAGCGADAAPYFRIFNPILQGAKFDPDGAYVRRWLPELARLPTNFIHRPWEASPAMLAEAGVSLGKTYPAPIVEHGAARRRALAAYEATKRKAA